MMYPKDFICPVLSSVYESVQCEAQDCIAYEEVNNPEPVGAWWCRHYMVSREFEDEGGYARGHKDGEAEGGDDADED